MSRNKGSYSKSTLKQLEQYGISVVEYAKDKTILKARINISTLSQNALQGTQEALRGTKDTNRYSDTPMDTAKINSGSVMPNDDDQPVIKFHGTRLHSSTEIKRIEENTGLKNGGFFSDDRGCLIPVFFKPERTQDEMMEKVLRIQHGR
jgi:hypothetical protein